MDMDTNTTLLLEITKQLGGVLADMVNLKSSILDFRAELTQMKMDIKTHEITHVELAPKKDTDELWEQIRKHDTRLLSLEQMPGQQALARDSRIKIQFISIAVGVIGLGILSFLVNGFASSLIQALVK